VTSGVSITVMPPRTCVLPTMDRLSLGLATVYFSPLMKARQLGVDLIPDAWQVIAVRRSPVVDVFAPLMESGLTS
jgi:hypothetical protein